MIIDYLLKVYLADHIVEFFHGIKIVEKWKLIFA
jgi:hypothetical protein